MDVYRNLAIEEYLMEREGDAGPILFLWRSDGAVVMGKNQNPWRECRLDRMRADGVPLARRISGGGTVFHDPGNLNFCVVVDRRAYREQQAYDMVFHALESFGIRAEKTGKSNLSVDGRKFSGNAFCFRGNRALHHGTLLLQADLARLDRYLGSMVAGIETHAIPSVPAPVANLSLDVAAVSAALIRSFLGLYGGQGVVPGAELDIDSPRLEPLLARQRSAEWIFGATPRFALEAGGLRLEVAKGVVQDAGGHAFGGQWFADLAFSLLC